MLSIRSISALSMAEIPNLFGEREIRRCYTSACTPYMAIYDDVQTTGAC